MKYFGKILNHITINKNTVLKLQINKDIEKELINNNGNIEIRVDDGRIINPEQRKKAYATINDIAIYTGDLPEFIKEYFKYKLMIETGREYFSLSDCSVTTAKEYINLLIDFCIDWEIPLTDIGINRTDDIDRYLFKCLETRTCCITGRKGADIHHVVGSHVGMGRNRNKINHNNLEIIALSREWHNKVHQEGENEIFNKFKIYGLKVDGEILKKLGLRLEEID